MSPLLLRGPEVQLESFWLLPRYVHCYCTLRVIGPCWASLWLIGVIARSDYWFLLYFGACVVWKLVLKDEAFRSIPVQGSLGFVSEVHSVFRNKDLPPITEWKGATRANSNILYCLGMCWTSLTNKSKESFSCLVLGFLLDGLWLLKGALLVCIEKKLFIYIQTYVHYR